MAKRRPQVRFVVKVGGELRRLFSVREGSDGQLLIRTHNGGTDLIPGLTVSFPLKESRFTVHLSQKSPTGAKTIHKTDIFEGGERRDNYILTHAIEKDRFEAIYSATMPDLRANTPLAPHANDVIIELPDYNPDKCTLVTSLWLSRAEHGQPFPLHHSYSVLTHKFKVYALHVAYGYALRRSRLTDHILHYFTTPEGRLTPELVAGGFPTGISNGSLYPDVIAKIVRDFDQMLTAKELRVGPGQHSRFIVFPYLPRTWKKPAFADDVPP